MNRSQKWAWLIVVLTLSWLALNIVVSLALYPICDEPVMFTVASFVVIYNFIIMPSLTILFRETKGKVKFDERDKLIQKNALLTGALAAGLFFGLACLIPLFILNPNTRISIWWLAFISGGAGLTYFFTMAISILVQYGWKEKNNE